MSTTRSRGPNQTVQARELKPGDYIPSRQWTVLATREQDDGNTLHVSATSSAGLVRQTVFPADALVEIFRG